MKRIIALIIIMVAFASAKDYTKIFMNLIDKLENCELSKDTTTEIFGRELHFGCNEDTVEFHMYGLGRETVKGISINTVEYYEGIKVTAYRFFIHSGTDVEGNPYKGSYHEVYQDELGIYVRDVEIRLEHDLNVPKIYTYFMKKYKNG